MVDDLSRPVVGATVRATWRPELAGEHDVAIGLTDARGQVPWTPDRAGTVVVGVRDTTVILHSGAGWPDPTTGILLVALTLGCGVALGVGAWATRNQGQKR